MDIDMHSQMVELFGQQGVERLRRRFTAGPIPCISCGEMIDKMMALLTQRLPSEHSDWVITAHHNRCMPSKVPDWVTGVPAGHTYARIYLQPIIKSKRFEFVRNKLDTIPVALVTPSIHVAYVRMGDDGTMTDRHIAELLEDGWADYPLDENVPTIALLRDVDAETIVVTPHAGDHWNLRSSPELVRLINQAGGLLVLATSDLYPSEGFSPPDLHTGYPVAAAWASIN